MAARNAGALVRKVARRLLLPAVIVGLMLPSAPASADGSTAGADVSVAQTLGGRELTVVLRRITSIPGPLHVDVIGPRRGRPEARCGFRSPRPALSRRGAAGPPRASSPAVARWP